MRDHCRSIQEYLSIVNWFLYNFVAGVINQQELINYIDLFNHGKYKNEFSGFTKIMYMSHPVLHELWMGAKTKKEINHLLNLSHTFIKLKRLIKPLPKTRLKIGIACQKLYSSGLLDPRHPKIYNDVCIAQLTRQIGAILVTKNIKDFEIIQKVIDFKFRLPEE